MGKYLTHLFTGENIISTAVDLEQILYTEKLDS